MGGCNEKETVTMSKSGGGTSTHKQQHGAQQPQAVNVGLYESDDRRAAAEAPKRGFQTT